MNKNIFTRYGYVWVTSALFLVSIAGHWLFAWFAFVDEAATHGEAVQFDSYFIEVMRDTLENWQSEFLQLIWQVAGLAFLLYIGSPQSKEGDDRKEEKIDEILRLLDHKNAEKTIARLDQKYIRKK